MNTANDHSHAGLWLMLWLLFFGSCGTTAQKVTDLDTRVRAVEERCR